MRVIRVTMTINRGIIGTRKTIIHGKSSGYIEEERVTP